MAEKSKALLLACAALVAIIAVGGPVLAAEPAPGEADELAGWADAALKNAKGPADYDAAARAYQKALQLSPGTAEYYRGLALAQEKGGHYQDAIASFRSYLLAAPDAPDAREIHRRIGALTFQASQAPRASGQAPAQESGALVDQFKKMAAKGYDVTYECGHDTPLEALRKSRPMECNQEELSGGHWHRVEMMAGHQLRLPKDGTIQLWSVAMLGKSLELLGKPQGPVLEDIVWTRCGGTQGCVKPVWVQWEKDLSAVTVSLDRPVEEKDFDPKARYVYTRYAAIAQK